MPHNTAPATDTSLRDSIEQDAAAARKSSGSLVFFLSDNDTGSFSVEELLSSYSINSLLVEPANNYELEHLFSTSQSGTAGHAGSGLNAASLPVH